MQMLLKNKQILNACVSIELAYNHPAPDTGGIPEEKWDLEIMTDFSTSYHALYSFIYFNLNLKKNFFGCATRHVGS